VYDLVREIDWHRQRRVTPRGVAAVALITASCATVTLSPMASYAVRAVTAVLTAVALIGSVRRRDATFLARCLIGLALLAGTASCIVAVSQVLLTGAAGPPGSLRDWLNLAATPLTVAGLLAMPGQPGGRIRTVAEGTVAAGSLWFLVQVLVIDRSGLSGGLTEAGRVVALGYLLCPVFVVSILLTLLSRTTVQARAFLFRTAAGVGLLAVADMLTALSTMHGGHPAPWISGTHQLGLSLVLVATVTARRLTGSDRAPADPLAGNTTAKAVLPYIPLTAALVVAFTEYLAHRPITREQTPPVLVLAAAVVVRHIAALRDHRRLVQELAASEQAARAEALRDPLTGLANRTAFVGHLGDLLTDRRAHPVAVALLDLNNFKDVNDTHGHDTGDVLLRRCAERLATVSPHGGLVARLGGDEFAICQPRAADGGTALLDAVVDAFRAPLPVDQRHFPLRPSVGVVVDERAPGAASADDAMRLLAHADVAMYQAKAGKVTRASTGVVLAGAARIRAAALIRLREEISQPDLCQFRVLYQPVVHLGSGTITGVEALIRWRHPELGPISPAEFIPLAEQVGSVAVLGEYVLATAVADLAAWESAAPAYRLSMGVNLSPRQLTDPRLPARVVELVRSHGLDTDQLMLEITETALVDDLDSAVELVAELRAAGMSVAVDDFGTGYSSLRYLRRFPADVVKIDREFVSALVGEPRTAALVQSVVDMAGALDLQTVAEGIETLEQLHQVQRLGCELGQGYLFSRPVDAAAIEDLLLAGHTYPVADQRAGIVPRQAPWRVDLRAVDPA
jgi:diguanylate cyclase (GGDEF)-like protein